jgi:hypothetical protein
MDNTTTVIDDIIEINVVEFGQGTIFTGRGETLSSVCICILLI